MADRSSLLERPAAEGSGRSRTVQSVGRALDLLELLEQHEQLALGELARRTGLHPSTAHRLLATLAGRGYVVQDRRTGHYGRAARATAVVCIDDSAALLRTAARPYLERARKVSGQTANLALPCRDGVAYIDQMEGSHPTAILAKPGSRVPAHATGAGKALLAARSADVTGVLMRDRRYRGLTERTITSASDLERELLLVRRRGYAIDEEEHEAGVSCVAAPLFDHRGWAIAAISISGVPAQLQTIGMRDLGELLVMVTRDLSGQLRHARSVAMR